MTAMMAILYQPQEGSEFEQVPQELVPAICKSLWWRRENALGGVQEGEMWRWKQSQQG